MAARSLAATLVVLLALLALPLQVALGQQPPAPPAGPAAPTAAAPPAVPAAPTVTPIPAPAPVPAPADLLPPEMVEPVARLSRSIETAEKSIQQIKELEGELSRLRTDVERIIYESTATAENLRPQLAEVKSQIEKLGPVPGKDQPPETPTVAAERARLNAVAGALDSAIKTSELAWVRAKQLIDRITTIRYQQFTRNLFERRDSPLSPGVWREIGSRMEAVAGRFRYYGQDWMTWAGRKSNLLLLLGVALVLLYGAARYGAGRVIAKSLVRPDVPPSFFERTIKAAWVTPLKVLPGALTALLAYGGLESLELLFSPWEATSSTLLKGILIFAAVSALVGAVFQHQRPWWRLIPVSDRTARALKWLVLAFVGVYVLDTVLVEVGRAIYVPLVITVAQAFVTSMVFVGLLVALLLTPFEPLVGPDRPVNGHVFVAGPVSRHAPLWLKVPLWLIAAAILVAAMLGYVALGRFIAHQLVLSGSVLATAGLFYLAIRAATRGRANGRDVVGDMLEARLGLTGQRRTQLSRLIEFTLTFALALVALPALLLQWGFSGADVRDWLKGLLFGFEIGQFRISLFRILIGIGLFTGLLFLTRLCQRWLRDRVLADPRMDQGIANSIETAVGYGGTTMALLLAVSYAGFDITSLAIVAGALSVGIGFGLQSIVNNFVSGLILLVERPIKVGDWIVVGDQQGNVRRISVRSTEIETFDRSSLIIPNSELISGRVLNWTHRNQLGRSLIKITLDGNVDPERVIKVLKACAASHPEVMQTPPPSVTFDSFTTAAQDFTLRVTLTDVYKGGHVATELRVAILKIFREQGIVSYTPPTPPTSSGPPPLPPQARPA